MQLGLALAVALLVVGVVAWPFVSSRWRGTGNAPDPEDSDGQAQNDAAALEDVYEAIRTLQMERSLGRVGDGDFRKQLDEYRRQAATIMRDMDRESRKERDG